MRLKGLSIRRAVERALPRPGLSWRRAAITHPHVVVVVQNLPVPLDRRVWLECQALRAAGYEVSVICPKGPGDSSYQEINGVRIYKYAPPPTATGAAGYLLEFTYCWLRTALLSARVWRRQRFDVLQACNPPDTYWALARLYKAFGVRFVFDHHDLNPEVFRSRFGEPSTVAARLQHALLLWLERRTFRSADHVIATNESYRRVAIQRGGVPRECTTVVRSGPSTARMRPIDGLPELRHGREYLLVYLGIMGPQDGVDLVLRVMDVLVHKWGRSDVHAALLGFGDSYDQLVALAKQLNLDDYVTFTGRVGAADITRYLSTADVGICPDPLSPLNDVSTMNKTMEYMSFALPVVAFDLTETRVSGGEAAYYVAATSVIDEAVVEKFAAAVHAVLDDPDRRSEMALAGRRRAEGLLDWAPQRENYLSVFDRLTGHTSPPPREIARDDSMADQVSGGLLVDIGDDDAVRAFARHRSIPVVRRPDDTVVFKPTRLAVENVSSALAPREDGKLENSTAGD